MDINSLNSNFLENQHNLDKVQDTGSKALERVMALREINSADSASLLMADTLASQIHTAGQGIKNANDGVGILQIADTTLNSLSESSMGLETLSVKMNSDALNSSQKSILQVEAVAIKESMSASIENATFNGQNVFGREIDISVGTDSISTMLNTPNIDSLDITDSATLKSFSETITDLRSETSGNLKQFASSIAINTNQIAQFTSSESQLQSSDMVQDINTIEKTKLQEEATIFARVHNMNLLEQNINSILGA